jgi:outer membrane protein
VALRAASIGIALALGAALLTAPCPVPAQQSITVDAITFAKAAIASGNDALARQVLDRLAASAPADIETNFLLATLDAKEGKLDAAIARYRRILLDHPDLVRVRLDYALALFRAGDDDNADYNFRLALDAQVPDAVRDQVMAYLHAIRARSRFRYDVAASVAPDTNINAGPAASEITLFGLPFTPSDTTKRQSGVGAMVSVSGEERYPIEDTLRWRSNAGLWRTEYPGGQFDDMILRTEMGPQFLWQDWDASALGVYTQRWYGNDPYDNGAGPRLEFSYRGFQRFRLESDFEILRLGYHTETFENGNYLSANFYPDITLPPTAFVRPILGFIRQITQSPVFADTGYRLGLGYHQELTHGITVELQGEMLLSYYDAPSALFGTTRRDQTLQLQASIYRRDWIVFGFDPVFGVIFTRNASNQALYAFRREQFDLGFTKEF